MRRLPISLHSLIFHGAETWWLSNHTHYVIRAAQPAFRVFRAWVSFVAQQLLHDMHAIALPQCCAALPGRAYDCIETYMPATVRLLHTAQGKHSLVQPRAGHRLSAARPPAPIYRTQGHDVDASSDRKAQHHTTPWHACS
jgi:hypothetical protein